MINVEKLTFYYEGTNKPAVDGVSFAVKPGEIFGFLGPNGAGKSTTQKILIGLLNNYHGIVKISGTDLAKQGKDYYERVGVGFELPNHYQKLTALENLQFFSKLFKKETEDPMRLLEMVNLKNDAHTKVSNFSKGMQMRLNFARSLINKPEIIFLDEPTSGLDPASARAIKDIILDLKAQGRTVFLTTHNMFIADELCDRVAFIVDGKINLIESPSSLKIKHGERAVAVSYYIEKSVMNIDFNLDGLGDNEEFLRIIRNNKVRTIHTKEPTLEDIFICVTGRKLS